MGTDRSDTIGLEVARPAGQHLENEMPDGALCKLSRWRQRGWPRGMQKVPKRPGLIRSRVEFGLARRLPHKVYGRIGDLEVRLARTKADVKRAQRLRYEVF